MHKAKEAARKWVEWQRTRKTPHQVCESLAEHAALAEKTQKCPELTQRVRLLLERIPPETRWE
jgi:hypothetical protein